MQLTYLIDREKLVENKQNSLETQFLSIEQNFLAVFGLIAGPMFKMQPNHQLEKIHMRCLFDHQLKGTKNIKECVIHSIGDCFIFTNCKELTKLCLSRENLAGTGNPKFTQVLIPSQ